MDQLEHCFPYALLRDSYSQVYRKPVCGGGGGGEGGEGGGGEGRGGREVMHALVMPESRLESYLLCRAACQV